MIPNPLLLEDGWTDVMGKAIRGMQIDPLHLAARSGIAQQILEPILAGKRPEEEILRKLATALELQPQAFADLAFERYRPRPIDPARWTGIIQIPSRYMDIVVNSYLVWDANSREAILFDTGTEIPPIRQIIEGHGLKLSALCITHAHGDHVAILNEIVAAYHPRVFAPAEEPVAGASLIGDGATIEAGSLRAKALLTEGHSRGHLSYVLSGRTEWPAPAVIVGDAIFAGSMGGGAVSYARLRMNVRTKLLILPPDSLLCPGHGPMTTVAEEQRHNPFA